METNLRVFGYVTQNKQGEFVYVTVLKDGTEVVDEKRFATTGTTVWTPSGYPNTKEGARQCARDHWL
jgi:hypothetical protein